MLEPDDSKPPRPEEPIEALCGDPRGFLRLAAGAIAGAGSDNRSGDPEAGEKQEIRALARFGREAGLMLEARAILLLFAEKENRLAGGVEHEVAVLREEGLVIKDYDARLFKSLLKKPGMKNCESFCRMVRREDEVGRAPRLRSNAASRQNGRSPGVGPQNDSANAANTKPQRFRFFV